MLPRFRETEIYEVTGIRDLLNKIDTTDKPNLQRWVEAIRAAERGMNEEKYEELLNLIENGTI